jgi:hypothetical protein
MLYPQATGLAMDEPSAYLGQCGYVLFGVSWLTGQVYWHSTFAFRHMAEKLA